MIRSEHRSGPSSRLRSLLPLTALLGLAIAAPAAAQSPSIPAGLPTTAEEEIAVAGQTLDTSFCGTKPITLAIHDGLGVNAWSANSYAAVRSEAAKCSNVTQRAIQGNYDAAKANADVASLVAQGIDALTIIPDAGGQAQLQAIQDATAAGVKVVPWASNPYGAAADYVTYVDWDTVDAGRTWAKWMADALGGTGKIVFLGGPAGAPVGLEELQGIKEVFANYPNMELLTGQDAYGVTNWIPADAQKTMTDLLGQFPQIDGVISNYGSDADAAVNAFKAVGRPLVPIATLESNGLACDFAANQAANPKYQLATISSRNWLGRIAARKAIAAAEGIPNTEPSIYKLPLIEDTLNGMTPLCTDLATVGRDYFWSNRLSSDDLANFGKATE